MFFRLVYYFTCVRPVPGIFVQSRGMSGPTQTFDHSISGSDSEAPHEPVWGKFLALTPKTCTAVILKDDSYTFGRGKSNDVVLEHPGISGVHCRVWREAIEGMDKHTVWIEDQRFAFCSSVRMEFWLFVLRSLAVLSF